MRVVRPGPGRPVWALIVANGNVPSRDTLEAELMRPVDGEELLVIAADGGLRKAHALGLRPDLVIGDGDSLAPGELDDLARQGVEVQLHPRTKDASDTELAVREAARRGAHEIAVLGALGGVRFDHALANVLLLAATDIDASITLADPPTTVRVIGRRGPERIELAGKPGDLVSLLPLSDEVVGVTTTGLAYPLDGATLRQGPTLGLSNELTGGRGVVSVERGRLAVIQTSGEGRP